MRKFRVFSVGKDRFVIKIAVLTAKTRFSRRKEYFTFEIVFYSGKDRFVIKIPVLTPKRGFLVEKSTLHLKYYFTVETPVFVEKNM